MGQLELTTLGGLSLKLNKAPLIGLSSVKAQALVIYLVRTGHSHSRESLAGIFWPNLSLKLALANLRKLLTKLRPYLGTYLSITRQTLAFDHTQPIRFDVVEFEQHLSLIRNSPPAKTRLSLLEALQLEKALALYQGDFLKGFSLADSCDFEDWILQEQEYLHQLAIKALETLITYQLVTHRYTDGLKWVTKLIQLDPLHEEAHRQLMLLLAYSGQRSAALKHFHTYRQYLASELALMPEVETTNLYEDIRADKIKENPAQLTPELEPLVANVKEISISHGRLTRLKQVELFSATPLPILTRIASYLEEVYFKANQPIFSKGEIGHCMYIIGEGRVRIHDKKRLINDLREGDIFGEMSLLDAAPRLASATALLDTYLWRLNQTNLYLLMEERVEITHAILQILSRRLRERIDDLFKLDTQPAALATFGLQQNTD